MNAVLCRPLESGTASREGSREGDRDSQVCSPTRGADRVLTEPKFIAVDVGFHASSPPRSDDDIRGQGRGRKLGAWEWVELIKTDPTMDQLSVSRLVLSDHDALSTWSLHR
jgi:hypothetical protein